MTSRPYTSSSVEAADDDGGEEDNNETGDSDPRTLRSENLLFQT
jgi:hypothetical protein